MASGLLHQLNLISRLQPVSLHAACFNLQFVRHNRGGFGYGAGGQGSAKYYNFRKGMAEAEVARHHNTRIIPQGRRPPQFPPLNRNPPRKTLTIPKRIHRSPTAILEAIAGTIGRDPTAAGYRFMDDPYFIPATAAQKRIFALAKESGRRAARYIVERNPELFLRPFTDPEIPAFQASTLAEFKLPTNPTEQDLLSNLSSGKILNAMEIYRLMRKQNLEIRAEVQQELLEWLCFYNGDNAETNEFLDEDWFKPYMPNDTRKKWKKDGPAVEVFENLPEKTPAAYAAMIAGMAKYVSVESARTYLDEMLQAGMPIPRNVYTEMIRIIPMLQETYESRWEYAGGLLNHMHTSGVRPNLGTFNALLDLLVRCGGWRMSQHNAMKVLAEMKQLGIEPSLATYNSLLHISCRDRGPVNYILGDILDQLEGGVLEMRDPNDSAFFVTAMEISARHLQDPQMAKRVHALMSRDRHELFLPDGQKESHYYSNFFKALVNGDSLEGFFEQYEDLVPMAYTPDSGLIMEIIRMLEFFDRLDMLPRIWADCVVFGHTTRDSVVESFLRTMVSNPRPALIEPFATLAKDVRERIDNQPEQRENKMVWTGETVGHVALLMKRSGDLDSAWATLSKYLNQRGMVYGFPEGPALNEIVDALAERREFGKVKECLLLAADVGLVEVTERVEEIAQKLNLTTSQFTALKSALGTSAVDLSDTV